MLNPGIGQSVGVRQQVVNGIYEWEKCEEVYQRIVASNTPSSTTARTDDWSTRYSEKQAKVLTLPSQVCIHSLTLPPDNGCVMKSIVEISSHGTYLVCYSTSGNVLCPLVGYDL
ncbi:unnamed protein product [Clavelina lepadiformis]|uniref:Uncharacterized protein n=1 Tax=Clavelina lepadiformis TaxID=159417 RepID=A0ABP0FWD8_CLALP